MTAIELEGLSKSYGNTRSPALDGVDLSIHDGEFVVLLGPSGCGKSTTLRMIAGLEQPSSGVIRFDGQVVNDLPGRERRVGMVFQNYALYPHMTVEENLSFGLRSRGETKAKTAEMVGEVLAMLGLGQQGKRRPRELSGGQRQRVALGRALVGRPSVFLMDEPLSNLDANLREQMRMEIARLHSEHGITTVYVTHDQVEALTLADRIVVMDSGRVRQVATPRELYLGPADTFVARFIGSPGMNLLRVPLGMLEGREHAASPVTVPAGLLPRLRGCGGGEAVIGVRPENLHLDDSSNGVGLNCRVTLVEQLGTHLQVHLTLGAPLEELALVAKVPAGRDLRRGEIVTLSCRESDIHLFDTMTGLRLAQQPHGAADRPLALAGRAGAPNQKQMGEVGEAC
ncbi:MAG: ABC transporter ATP-binding protein [Nitrospiraceae bacterium]|nr:ABC transporter ATP-binding protein [Nitrospiraceae bacterium]